MTIGNVRAVGAELAELVITANDPLIVVVFGKVGVGKTTVAAEVAFRLGAQVLNSDEFRRKRFSGIQYQEQHSLIALKDVVNEAQKLCGNGVRSIVLDATFSKLQYREMARALAKRSDKRIVWIEVVCLEELSDGSNIDGKYVLRKVDDLVDVGERIVIDNSVRSQNSREWIKRLVDQFVIS